jgi:hypothetical protein
MAQKLDTNTDKMVYFYLEKNIRRGGGTVEPQVGVRFLIRQGHHHRILYQREIISQKRD